MRTGVWRPALGLVAAATLVACGDDLEPLLERWERDGGATSSPGFDVGRWDRHCDDSVLYLTLTWPIEDGVERWFVRDPEGVLSAISMGSFDEDAELPDDAVATGFDNAAGIELWLTDDASTAYLVDDGDVEAWPALAEPLVCA